MHTEGPRVREGLGTAGRRTGQSHVTTRKGDGPTARTQGSSIQLAFFSASKWPFLMSRLTHCIVSAKSRSL